jgi:NADH-quinone oxidoreductase subunit M
VPSLMTLQSSMSWLFLLLVAGVIWTRTCPTSARRWGLGVVLLAMALDFWSWVIVSPGRLTEHQQGPDVLLSALSLLWAWLALLAVVPRAVSPARVAWVLALTAVRLLIARCTDDRLSVVLLAIDHLIIVHPVVLRTNRFSPSARSCRGYAWISIALAAIGGLLAGSSRAVGPAGLGSAAGTLALLASVFCVLGILPFQSWRPRFCELGGPLAVAAVLSAAEPAFVLARLAQTRPAQLAEWGPVLTWPVALTALYAASLCIVQTSPARWLGWFAIYEWSASACGILATSTEGRVGGEMLAVSSSIGLMGLTVCWIALEARIGVFDLGRFNGLARDLPWLGSVFLILGLVTVGFPGTLGFPGQELMLDGMVNHDGLVVAGVILVATAVAGISVMRVYLRIFQGNDGPEWRVPALLWREKCVLLALVLAMITGGLDPRIIAGYLK